MHRAIQYTSIAVVVVAAFALAYATVFAHAGYESSVPARNEVVDEPPERVEVFFTQDVVKREGLFYVRVFDEDGVQVSEGDGEVNDDNRRNINADLLAPLEPGRYIVEWMTTSDVDGDTDEGAFCFYVAVEPTEEQVAECAELDEEPAATPTQADDEPVEPTPTLVEDDPVDATPTEAPPPDETDDDGGNTALVIGIVAAVVVVIGLVAAGFVWLSRRG